MRLLSARAILVASDLTPTSDGATRTALNLSRASGASLHVLHVTSEDDPITKSGRRAEYVSELRDTLSRAGAGDHEYELDIATGDAPAAIADVADRIKADVVVLGRRRSDAPMRHARPLGGTAYAVVTRSCAPCLAITEPLELPLRSALVAIDRSETARGALLVAVSWVSAIRSRDTAEKPTLTVLQVEPGSNDRRVANLVDQKTIQHEVETLRRNAGAWAGVTVLSETMDGTDPAKVISTYARQIGSELVVLGTRGLQDPEEGMGSTSASVTKELTIPVLLVPPAVWRDHAKDIDYF